MIFFVFLEFCLFFAKQSLEHPAPLKICRVFEHCPIVLNVLLYDKTLHDPLQGRNFLRWPFGLDQRGHVQVIWMIFAGKGYFDVRLETDCHSSG